MRTPLYVPFLQLPDDLIATTPNGVVVVVRTRSDPADVVAPLRRSSRGSARKRDVPGAHVAGGVIVVALAAMLLPAR